MNWSQKGLIFVPDGHREWSRTHAQVPSALLVGNRIRVYYAARDDGGRSRTGFIEVEAANPAHILYDHPHPVMDLGAPGTHDEDGVMVGSVLQDGDEVLLYYTGWSKGGSVAYRVSCGLAVSHDGGITFERAFEGPVVDRTRLEPHMTMSPYVMKADGLWRMWYGSGLSWVSVGGQLEPIYAIKYADSDDGRLWRQSNVLCIAQEHPMEANTRPSVLKTSSGYEMWFSYRHSVDYRDGSGGYRLGHAVSDNGLDWRRENAPPSLQPGTFDWCSSMMAYPSVVEINGTRVMFHNGNGFGRSGFGYSVFE